MLQLTPVATPLPLPLPLLPLAPFPLLGCAPFTVNWLALVAALLTTSTPVPLLAPVLPLRLLLLLPLLLLLLSLPLLLTVLLLLLLLLLLLRGRRATSPQERARRAMPTRALVRARGPKSASRDVAAATNARNQSESGWIRSAPVANSICSVMQGQWARGSTAIQLHVTGRRGAQFISLPDAQHV